MGETFIWDRATTLTENCTIKHNDTLKIEKGITVSINSPYRIKVIGTLLALGELNDSITFTSDSTWQGITIIGNSTSQISYSIIEKCIDSCAITVENPGNLILKNSTIQNNSNGGLEIQDRDCIVENCKFTSNKRYNGAGIFVRYQGGVSIRNCIINNNQAFNEGGGIYIDHSIFETTIENCQLYYNRAQYGGAIGTSSSQHTRLTLNNSLLYENWAQEGSAIMIHDNEMHLYNCTITKNHGPMITADRDTDEMPIHRTMINTILATSSNEALITKLKWLRTEKCLFSDRVVGHHENHFIEDPHFVDYDNNNFRLSDSSIGVNNGIAHSNTTDTDLDGNKRIYNDGIYIVDIGAYEYQKTQPPLFRIDTVHDVHNGGVISSDYIDTTLFRLHNHGGEELTLDSITVLSSNTKHIYPDSIKTTLHGNDSCSLYLVFKNDKVGKYKEQIVVYTGGNKEDTISLQYNVNLKVFKNTTISGTLSKPGPYIFDGKVTVPKDSMLQIEPGTTILFRHGSSVLDIHGTFHAIGGKENIHFSPIDNKNFGGAIYLNNQIKDSSIIHNCNFTSLRMLALLESSHVRISSSKFTGRTNSENSAIRLIRSNCIISNIIISDRSKYEEYEWGDSRGAAILAINSNFVLKNSSLYNNRISQPDTYTPLGAAISCFGGTPYICNNYIYNNRAEYENNEDSYGGAIYLEDCDATIVGNVLYDNNARSGSAIYSDSSKVLLVNNTIADNGVITASEAAIQGVNSNISIVNSILWNKSQREIIVDSTITVQNSCIQGGFSGKNNISKNPKFMTKGEEYIIDHNSPCLDKGSKDTTGLHLPQKDIRGMSRIDNNTIDIGAYELIICDVSTKKEENNTSLQVSPQIATKQTQSINFSDTKGTITSYRIYDALGNEIGVANGKSSSQWDLRNRQRRRVSSGIYSVFITVIDSNGKMSVVKKSFGVKE